MSSEPLLHGRVLVELGELGEAEREVNTALAREPDVDLLSLLGKIKHMQGELSQAIGIWAQIRGQMAHDERALTALGAILHLSANPQAAASDFVPVGPFEMTPKTVAHRELEKPFREFVARRPDEARASCDHLAQRALGTDRDLFKLAVMAKAWISELSGDLAGACGELERLADVRGFETDIDRVLGLARLYERMGTPDRLASAARIQQHLEKSFVKISALGRLAALHKKLGRDDLASEYERRHLAAFRERMHRVSMADVLTAASTRYYPLEQLARLALSDGEPLPDAGDRARAIGAALRRDFSGARDLLGRGVGLLDAMYLADVAALEGDAAGASRGFLAALRRAPDDTKLLSALLDAYARAPSGDVADALVREPLRARALAILAAALAEAPLRPERWRAMSILHGILGDSAEAARCDARARALAAASDRDARAIGRVLAAAVLQFPGKGKGLIHQIWADRRPAAARGRGGFLSSDDIFGNISADMKQGIRNSFLAVREYARSRFPEQTQDILDWDYTYKITKEDEPSDGLSAGLPTAVAFLSVFLRLPVGQDLAFSGVLVSDSHDALAVRRVGDVDEKVKGACNRNLRSIVLPADNRGDLAGGCAIPIAVESAIVRYARTLDDALALTFGQDIWLK